MFSSIFKTCIDNLWLSPNIMNSGLRQVFTVKTTGADYFLTNKKACVAFSRVIRAPFSTLLKHRRHFKLLTFLQKYRGKQTDHQQS